MITKAEKRKIFMQDFRYSTSLNSLTKKELVAIVEFLSEKVLLDEQIDVLDEKLYEILGLE